MSTYAVSLADVLRWAEAYEGPPFHALLSDAPYHLTTITKRFGAADAAPAQFGNDGAFQRALTSFCALKSGIGPTVAGVAESNEVAQIVGFAVVIESKEAKGLDVMHVRTRSAAVLTSVIIALQRFAPLRLPVRAALLASFTTNVLRVVQAVAVGITTGARAVLAPALALAQHAFIHPKLLLAMKAVEVLNPGALLTSFQGRVLAIARAMLTTTVLDAGRNLLKRLSAVLTN